MNHGRYPDKVSGQFFNTVRMTAADTPPSLEGVSARPECPGRKVSATHGDTRQFHEPEPFASTAGEILASLGGVEKFIEDYCCAADEAEDGNKW